MTLQQTILPPESYIDPDVYQLEIDRIFCSTWMQVCHVSQVPRAGDYLTYTIGDQSIVVRRGADQELHAFYNVCQHRGRELFRDSGNARAIVCPYHGWTYGDDGALVHARGSELVPGFDRCEIRLRTIPMEIIAGFVFVNLNGNAESFAATYPGFEAQLRQYEPAVDELIHVRRTTFDLAVNWKVAVENYLEAYHLVNVHPALRSSVNNDTWQMTLFPKFTSLIGHADPKGDIAYDFTQADKLIQSNWWLWPMVMFEQMPGGSQLFTYNHVPLGPERTLQVVDFYFPDNSLCEAQLAEIDYIEKVVRVEDQVAIEGVQRGLHSRGYRRGPLIMGPDVPEEITEKGILHFQNLVSAAMTRRCDKGTTPT